MRNLIVFVFAVICYVNAIPVAEEYGSQNGYRNYGNWPPSPPMSQFRNIRNIQWPKPLSPQDVANMKPAPGATFDGLSSVVTSNTHYVDGKPVTETKGQTLWNDNGTVKKETFGN